jgi:nitroreductase
MDHKTIEKAIIKSQHCQRNWNLSKQIPAEDMDLLIHAATQCPSKQNVAYYDVHVITDRNIIEEIHDATNGFIIDPFGNTTTNSQVLANVLFAFTPTDNIDVKISEHRNEQLDNIKRDNLSEKDEKIIFRDRCTSIGIASGYLNLTASMLGYSTGCCACFDSIEISKIIKANQPVELLMGIGYSDETKNRRIHHTTGKMFPTKKKQPVAVYFK